MNNQAKPIIEVPSLPGMLLKISTEVFYFEKKELNQNRDAFRKCEVKVNYPNDKNLVVTAFLNEKFYLTYPSHYLINSSVGVEKHLSGIHKGFWIVKGNEFKEDRERLLKLLLGQAVENNSQNNFAKSEIIQEPLASNKQYKKIIEKEIINNMDDKSRDKVNDELRFPDIIKIILSLLGIIIAIILVGSLSIKLLEIVLPYLQWVIYVVIILFIILKSRN